MYNYLLINATSYENRIALVEHGNLVEFFIERPSMRGLVGNIYRGRVVRVLPGIQAAFVDIGLERTGFLYVDDIHLTTTDLEKRMLDNDSERSCCSEDSSAQDTFIRMPLGVNIDNLLTEGQDILVQVCKEPIGTKGARLTCHISLPCRNLVFMPMTDHIGISRKIENEETRERLRQEIETLRPPGTGFIVRTVAAENATREDLEADMEFLLHLWNDEIKDRVTVAPVPALVFEDLDITLRAVRDLLTPTIDRVVIDNEEVFNKVDQFVKTFAPDLQSKVYHYQQETPVFDAYGVEFEINKALDKKVWLRSGGYIIIETTEALSVVDVNTGRFVGKNDLEDTIFKTNIEAVKEIAYQLRLRNIGGIIIIDFIDMEDESHREEVFNVMQEAVKKDKSRINILKLTEFGLVQMTRKRNRDNLSRSMCEPCFYCGGDGFIKSRRTICFEIFRKITRDAQKNNGNDVMLRIHPEVADLMLKEEVHAIENLEKKIGKRITIIPNHDIHIKKYEIIWGHD